MYNQKRCAVLCLVSILMLASVLLVSTSCLISACLTLIVENQTEYDLTISVNDYEIGNVGPGEEISDSHFNMNIGEFHTEAKNLQGETVFSKWLAFAQMQEIESRVYKVVIPPLKKLPPVAGTTFTSILPFDVEKTTLRQARFDKGMFIPTPTSLPKGYKIQEVYYSGSDIILHISDEEIEYSLIPGTSRKGLFQCKMQMIVSWSSQEIPGGLNIPGREVSINPYRGTTIGGVIQEGADHKTLWWRWRPDPVDDVGYEVGIFEVAVSVPKDFPEDILVKVFESIY
jgi:hypothetical protein